MPVGLFHAEFAKYSRAWLRLGKRHLVLVACSALFVGLNLMVVGRYRYN